MRRKDEKCKEEIRILRNSVDRVATCEPVTTNSHSLLQYNNSMQLIDCNDTPQSDYCKMPTDDVEASTKKYSEAVVHSKQARKKSTTSDKETQTHNEVPSRPFLNEESEAVDSSSGCAIMTTDSASLLYLTGADKAMQTNTPFITLSLSEEFKTTINPEKVVEECASQTFDYDMGNEIASELRQTTIKMVEDRASQTFEYGTSKIADEFKQATIDSERMIEDCTSQTSEYDMGSEITDELKQTTIDSEKMVKDQTFEQHGMENGIVGELKPTSIINSEKMVEDRTTQTFEHGTGSEIKQTTVHSVEDCASQTFEHGIENEIADELKRQLKQRNIEVGETTLCHFYYYCYSYMRQKHVHKTSSYSWKK